MEFKDRIKQLRAERNMTTTQLGAELGKSDTAIRMWETGRSKPDADTLITLSKLFSCSVDYLLGLAGYKDSAERQNANKAFALLEKNMENIPSSMDFVSYLNDIVQISSQSDARWFYHLHQITTYIEIALGYYCRILEIAKADGQFDIKGAIDSITVMSKTKEAMKSEIEVFYLDVFNALSRELVEYENSENSNDLMLLRRIFSCVSRPNDQSGELKNILNDLKDE